MSARTSQDALSDEDINDQDEDFDDDDDLDDDYEGLVSQIVSNRSSSSEPTSSPAINLSSPASTIPRHYSRDGGGDGSLQGTMVSRSSAVPSFVLPASHASHPTIASPLKGYERKQLQRRLLEAPSHLSSRLLEAFHMDRLCHRTRLPARPDRGKLTLQLEVQRGFSINSQTAVAKRETRLVQRLPPVLGERASRVTVVQQNTSTGTRSVLHPPPVRIEASVLREMGYSAPTIPDAVITNEISGVALSSSPSGSPQKYPRLTSSFSLFGGDMPLPPPSGGPIEEVDEATRLLMERRQAVLSLFPHLSVGQLPPELNFKAISYPVKSKCTPPRHRRKDDREQRLISMAEELERLILSTSEGQSKDGVENTTGHDTTVTAEVEATPKPEGVDDRGWGYTVRDPQAEAAARLRLRMESQQLVPSNTPNGFGAVDHLIEVCVADREEDNDAPLPTTVKSRGDTAVDGKKVNAFVQKHSGLLRKKTSLFIPACRDPRDDLLLVLAVGVTGSAEEATLPYSDAEVNAKWFATVMEHVGAKVTLLRGYEATQEAIREAVGGIVGQARRFAMTTGQSPKIVVYFSGKGRLGATGDLFFAPHDAVAAINEESDKFIPSAVNLHELANRMIDYARQPESPRSPRGGPRFNADGDETTRWNFPIVVYDLIVDRGKQDDRPYHRPVTPAEKLDFWRGKYYGGILALQHEGGTLSLSCSSRHHGLVVYYFCKAAEGKHSGRSGHVGSISQITQFIAEKLRRRVLPTMELRCAPLPDDFAGRTAEEIFHPNKTLFVSQASKREGKRTRERKPCRWTMYAEVGIEYRYNPNRFVTSLTKRLKELLHLKQKTKPKNVPPLMVWMGSRRMEHRFYLPMEDESSMDVFRYDLLSCITRSGIAESGGSGQYYVAAALESIEHCKVEMAAGEHCVLMHSQGVSHNRWTYNPFVQGLMPQESMGGIRSHSDADLDFVYVLAECASRTQHIEVLSFLDGKHSCEVITVHCSGSVNDLRRLMKFQRLGLLDIGFCRNFRILRVEVASLGENEIEEAAAVAIQKMIRRFLTSRVMKSRLAAAMSFLRQHQQLLVDEYSIYGETIAKWFVDFQEGAFTALEEAQKRCRRDIRDEEAESIYEFYTQLCEDWVVLEERCRDSTRLQELVDSWTHNRLYHAIPEFGHALQIVQSCSQVEHHLRYETEYRNVVVCCEFAERRQLRISREADWKQVLAACAPVRLGKRVKKPKLHYELPLEILSKF